MTPASIWSEWLQFRNNVMSIIPATAKTNADSCLKIMTAIIVSYASEKLGHAEKGNAKTATYTINQRATNIP